MLILPGVVIGVLVSVAMSLAAETAQPLPEVVLDEPVVVAPPVIVDYPAFPAVVPREVFRISAGSFVAPEARFGDSEISLVRPEIRARASVPFSALATLQVTADFKANFYDLEGHEALFTDCAECPAPDELYSTSLGTQGGYRLNSDGHLFLSGEQWALLGALFVQARWEAGAFSDSLTPGCSFGLGYQLPYRFRLAVGGRVERALDGGGVAVSPSIYGRWDILPSVQLKSRGLGGQLEYYPSKHIDLFVTGFRESDGFRLDDRPGLSSGATFRDKRALVGAGMLLTVIRGLNLEAEVGAIVDHRVSLSTRADGRIDSRRGDPSPYFALRAEARL